MTTARDSIRSVLASIAPEAGAKARSEAERELLMALSAALVQDGYTLALAATALGTKKTTLSTWRARFPEYREALAEARDESRKWLLGRLKQAVNDDSRWAGKAANILAHLWFDELRSSKVEATVSAMPDPGESKAAILAIGNKGRQVDPE